VSMITLDPDCATNDAEHLVVETLPHDAEPRIPEVDEELSSSGNWILGSPPPPPPPGTPSKRKSRRTPQTLENPSPGPRTSTTPAATPRASGSKKTRFFGDDFVPPSRNQVVGVVPCPDTTTDAATESESKPEPSARSTGAKLNRNFSPVSSAVVMRDSKLAEKVDFAISVAASKFEEQVEKAASAESIHVVAHEDVSGGAFTTWSVLSGPASAEQDGERDPPHLSNHDPIGVDASITSLDSGATTGTSAPKSVEAGALNDPGKRGVCPLEHPSPFEDALERAPQILSTILSFLGDPVAVCRVKMTSRACLQYVDENEHRLMRDAVRLGGMSMNVRPSFWLWVTLQKSSHLSTGYVANAPRAAFDSIEGLEELVREGRTGKWHHVIDRDVERAFGNLPPHKTGARFRTDSIVRALVTWGKNRIIKRGLKGSGPPPIPSAGNSIDSDDVSLAPTDTVSDWGGVTPAGSFTSSMSDAEARNDKAASRDRHSRRNKRTYQGDLALSGNALTEDMKASLQYKLSFILHALASAHPDVGYCQGMDYVVAHLLRILQDTVRWSAATGKLPSVMLSAPATRYRSDMSPQQRLDVYNDIDRSVVVEEACFRVMDSFLSVYNLRHFYWPELRCLKTCCLVFERLIKIKLPVLADHFEHHELNVGLFALGWFQTLFLYLPSMPSATVCHMWDIWLVERSFKIFFRVGTAILFLSQPILLNHELEGMMRYLNELSDATLLSPDILIACALQIKVTNRLLMELEREVTASTTAQGQ
jgi:Rab-GTPase-TBC domain